MKIKVISKKPLRAADGTPMLPGMVYEVSSLSGIRDHVQVIEETYQTKVVHEAPAVPSLAAGEPLSASQAAPASPEQTVTRRRRGRRSQQTEE